MDNSIFEAAVEWRPALSPERQADVDAHRSRFAVAAGRFRQIRNILGLSQVEAATRLVTANGFEVVGGLRSKDPMIEPG